MNRRIKNAFTLVELLVVIGIIAVLISILLPALSASRRQANGVKCMAALKQIGMAFKLYEGESKGWWPVTVYSPGGTIPQQRWQDMISKYLHKTTAQNYDDITQYRRSSVLWGCPEFTRSYEFPEAAALADRVRNGYGMSYYVTTPAGQSIGTSLATPGTLAYIDVPGSSIGRWYKASYWTAKPSAERGLIADSETHVIGASGSPLSRGVIAVQDGAWTGTTVERLPRGSTTNYVDVNGQRHLKPGRTIREIRSGKGTNMLFCDMSVRSIDPVEAWTALRRGTVAP